LVACCEAEKRSGIKIAYRTIGFVVGDPAGHGYFGRAAADYTVDFFRIG